MSNLWANKQKELGVVADDFVEQAVSDGKLTRLKPEPSEKGGLKALLKELAEVEKAAENDFQDSNSFPGHKKISVSVDYATFLKLQIIHKMESDKNKIAKIALSNVVDIAIKELYDSGYSKQNKSKAP
ncbi:hypothetical protein [Pseudomonas tohonis]|uniref:hypothetical protein n=1 Tax=Pseudomonas tohonis TaxID=2725477 RepID=UPI001F380DEB|nr:hypothetical protein [Pseudomonas tohonis]